MNTLLEIFILMNVKLKKRGYTLKICCLRFKRSWRNVFISLEVQLSRCVRVFSAHACGTVLSSYTVDASNTCLTSLIVRWGNHCTRELRVQIRIGVVVTPGVSQASPAHEHTTHDTLCLSRLIIETHLIRIWATHTRKYYSFSYFNSDVSFPNTFLCNSDKKMNRGLKFEQHYFFA